MESNLVRLFNSNNNDNCWSNNMANVNMTAKDKIIFVKNNMLDLIPIAKKIKETEKDIIEEENKMKNKDNEILEKIARILLKVDKGNLSDKRAIENIMKIMIENSTLKLSRYLEKGLKQ